MLMNRQSLSIALTGSGGSGVMTTGSLLLEAAARSGWHGFMSRSSGPQIRGGEAAAVRARTHEALVHRLHVRAALCGYEDQIQRAAAQLYILCKFALNEPSLILHNLTKNIHLTFNFD